MSYFTQYTCMSFTMRAMAAVLHWTSGIMVMLYEIILRLCHGYAMAVLWLLLQLLRQPGERLCDGCWASQERRNMSAFLMAPQVFFQPLSSHCAHTGFSKQWGYVNRETTGAVSRINDTLSIMKTIKLCIIQIFRTSNLTWFTSISSKLNIIMSWWASSYGWVLPKLFKVGNFSGP